LNRFPSSWQDVPGTLYTGGRAATKLEGNMNEQARLYEVVWIYENGLESPTGKRIALPEHPAAEDVLAAMRAEGFKALEWRGGAEESGPFEVMTSQGVMQLRPRSA
jgi:hypothetical protein